MGRRRNRKDAKAAAKKRFEDAVEQEWQIPEVFADEKFEKDLDALCNSLSTMTPEHPKYFDKWKSLALVGPHDYQREFGNPELGTLDKYQSREASKTTLYDPNENKNELLSYKPTERAIATMQKKEDKTPIKAIQKVYKQ